jgi:hypothetical protein
VRINRSLRFLCFVLLLAASAAITASCARAQRTLGIQQGGAPASTDGGAPSSNAGTPPVDDTPPCLRTCAADGRSVDTCDGVEVCSDNEQCQEGQCVNACDLAEAQRDNVGCDYYAVNMDIYPGLSGSCFVAFVTNTFTTAAHLELEFAGTPLDVEKYTRLPTGAGADIVYEAYDPREGLAPGQVAILFLANSGGVRCPVQAARTTGTSVSGTGWGTAFHIRSDVPVVAMQMLPYGGGSAAVTGSSLLLPTSAWGKNYVAVNAWPATAGLPSLNIAAMEDDTIVTILPKTALKGRSGVVDGSPANEPIEYTLDAGEVLQLSQDEELTGSPIASDKKIAVFGGSQCMYVPDSETGYCDHAEQQLPPVGALSNEYIAANHRPRRPQEKSFLYRVVGAVDGTKLIYDPPVEDAPSDLQLGEAVAFWSRTPFVVKSQDEAHPFLLFAYMTGGALQADYGDPDFVRVVAPVQYLSRYVFFTDPTYPETSLVVTRRRARDDREFADVKLACLGVVKNWAPVGTDGLVEVARVDLVRHDFEPQGNCDNGSQIMESEEPFGVTVWAWGGPETTGGSCGDEANPNPPGTFTCDVSYAYPAGESVRLVNDVTVPPVPR